MIINTLMEDLTVIELKKICKENSIKGYSHKRRKDIINLILSSNKVIVFPVNKQKKGSTCSKTGSDYEHAIHEIIRDTLIHRKHFHTSKDLGGSTHDKDLKCNFHKENDIGIEVKKCTAPDWGQFTVLFHGEIPPFVMKDLTYDDWTIIKNTTTLWNDCYIDMPSKFISKYYRKKGCQYIQISDYGLYYLEHDTCNFNVPKLVLEQRLRIRIKVHSTMTKKGFCSLSITASLQPKNIHKLKGYR